MLSKNMEQLWNNFSDNEKSEIEARYAHLSVEYMTLQEIRKSKNLTQDSMAELLGIKQENVSRMERRNDMRLSTIREYIEALGGTLQITATFADNKTINILNEKPSR
jgi:predicted transcriptional regulator